MKASEIVTRILLIRHGEAAKGPGIADPVLTELGHHQARKLAEQLAESAPLALVSSPKLRAQQTAQPIADKWRQSIAIEEAVIEIPSPEGIALADRVTWLRTLLDSEWDDNSPQIADWRKRSMHFLQQLQQDTAIFCHFMVINSVVAQIRGDRRVQQFRPDYASVTELALDNGELTIQRLGREKSSRIL